ncbi:MAG: M56 family metallopeptidase [Verrucomicrobiota bacterium]|jgi:beta-lactamase regulating signal transducer with metallopeptidase domain/DNA-binding beta-propeller fold protein YncE
MSAIISSFFGWLARASWQAAILTVIVLALQWVFQKQLSPRWRHALWLLVVARLALPFPPSSPISLFNYARMEKMVDRAVPKAVASQAAPQTAPQTAPETGFRAPRGAAAETEARPAIVEISEMKPAPAPAAKAPAAGASWFDREKAPRVWAALWAAGVLFFTGRIFGQNMLFLRRLGAPRPVADPATLALLGSCKGQMGVKAEIRLSESSLVKSPALYGLFRKTLLLPAGMTQQFSAGELRHIFLHELAHVKRRDMGVLWLVTVCKILHWFNPVLWFGFRRMAADRELACDELALSCAGERESGAYGETILKLLELCARPAAAPGLMGILEEKAQMRRRIWMIAKFRRHSRWSALAGLLLLAVGLVTLTDAETEKPAAAPEVAVTDQAVDAAIKQDIKERFGGSRTDLIKSLQANGQTYEDYRKHLASSLAGAMADKPSSPNLPKGNTMYASAQSQEGYPANISVTVSNRGGITSYSLHPPYSVHTLSNGYFIVVPETAANGQPSPPDIRFEVRDLAALGTNVGRIDFTKVPVTSLETNRDLTNAMMEYQATIAAYEKDREQAATAVFRLGLLYRQLGKTDEANEQFQRILREFPELTALTGLSQQYVLGLPNPPPNYVLSIGDVVYPGGVAVDSAGNVYVSDTRNNRIRKFTGQGVALTQWGGPGDDAGSLSYPQGLALDGRDHIYVADCHNHRVQEFTVDGTFVRQWGELGSGPGQFNLPYNVAVDKAGNVYVADNENNRVEKFTSEGVFLKEFGTLGRGAGQLQKPQGVAVDERGNVYVGDGGNGRIEKFSAGGAFLAAWQSQGNHDVAVDGRGHVYVVDAGEDCVRMYSSEGELLTQWGSKGVGPGQFDFVARVAVDPAGTRVFVTDANNNRVEIFGY